jgi:hypothetical protein
MKQIVERITIERSDVPESDWISIDFNQNFDLTGINENNLWSEEYSEQKISIVHWITIDLSDKNENADDSMQFCAMDGIILQLLRKEHNENYFVLSAAI